ncbi:ABC transporter permease [Stenotrophomonas sp. Sm10]|uniref:ABC transporter permease n=1 Tax=Stenotrophomonas sp. Sm10 TaxID=3002754 RepID=UPI0027E57293|nr:ABC transporter permease [Stenotrophomonas sp. Sm10]MDQ7310552.1 ABC transporter permease [Stenotrophomonas sp. Sm10]
MISQGFWTRLYALIKKETRQMLRDRSNLAVGLALPVALILLFGYGLSFDVKNAPLAVVLEDTSPTARQAVSGLQGSPYLRPLWAGSMPAAERMLRAGEVDGIVRVPVDFSRQLGANHAQVQLIVNGVDQGTATTIEGYVSGALASAALNQLDRGAGDTRATPGITLVQRMWFNEAGNSTWYLVPGLIALVMTLIGAFLTSLLIAREWERGTLESLFVTPVRPLELVLSKLSPYMVIGAIDLVLCLLAATFLFHVPMRGSLWVVALASLLYLTVSLLMGLVISGATRNQFVASQLALLVSFMPAMMLSGFVFDLRNMPVMIRVISQALPATHFMALIKTLFLAGNDWPMIFSKCGILGVYIVVLTIATWFTLRKRLD